MFCRFMENKYICYYEGENGDNMKIRIKLKHDKWDCSKTGKGKFITSLIPELKTLGCEITDSLDDQVDIDFQIARWHYKPVNCKKTVLRIGPSHVDKRKNHKWLNARKYEAVKNCDGLIYQSKFGKKMVDKFIGKPTGISTIIFNGAKIDDTVKPYHAVQEKYNFLASTRTWLKQKRLGYIIRAYRQAAIPDSCLWIAGEIPRLEGKGGEYKQDYWPVDKMRIARLGNVGDDVLKNLYKSCDAMIHMVWLDCMPNSVCEAIAGGCKILCNNVAGTKEVVKPSGGLVMRTEPKWKQTIVNTEQPPSIDVKMLAYGMKEILKRPEPKRDHVDIRNIARQYYEFFNEVLNGQ